MKLRNVKNHAPKGSGFLNTSKIQSSFPRTKVESLRKQNFLSIKKGQQEMVGFVVIVVLVIVISLILLIIYVKKPVQKENVEAENLIASTMDFTSDCVINPPNYETIQDLIKTCAVGQGQSCRNGDSPCEYLSRLEKDILSSAKKTDAMMKAYQLDISMQDKKVIPGIFEGNCSTTDRTLGSQRLIKVGESQISVRIALCYARE